MVWKLHTINGERKTIFINEMARGMETPDPLQMSVVTPDSSGTGQKQVSLAMKRKGCPPKRTPFGVSTIS
jgi:hypothetical protein